MLEWVQGLKAPQDESRENILQRIALRFYGDYSDGRTHELHVLLKNGTYVLIKAESYREVAAFPHSNTKAESRQESTLQAPALETPGLSAVRKFKRYITA